jgi:hypothetical protein
MKSDENYFEEQKIQSQAQFDQPILIEILIKDESFLKEKCNETAITEDKDDSKKKIDSNISLSKLLEKSVINFLEYSTIGGLSELGKRKMLHLRIFWMIVVFICLSYALVTIIEKINKYYNYEVILAFNKYQELPTKFPKVTICNQNPFNEQYAFKYLSSKYNTIDYGFFNVTQPQSIVDEIETKQTIFLRYNHITINQLKITLINDLNETHLSSIGYDLENDMLISCQYNGHSCSETKTDFKRFWNNIYGNCYTFNSGNYSYLTDNRYELQLEMIVCK